MGGYNGYENTVGQVGRVWFDTEGQLVELITVKDAAKEFLVSERTIQRCLNEGTLIGLKISGVWWVQRWAVEIVGETLDELPF